MLRKSEKFVPGRFDARLAFVAGLYADKTKRHTLGTQCHWYSFHSTIPFGVPTGHLHFDLFHRELFNLVA